MGLRKFLGSSAGRRNPDRTRWTSELRRRNEKSREEKVTEFT